MTPIFGLHENVLYSLASGVTGKEDDKLMYKQVLAIKKTKVDEETGEKTKKPIVLSIEETQRKDDLGKWFLISKKENLDWVQKVIDKYLIPTAKSRVAYNNHVNDNESFKLGVRPSNRTNTTMENWTN